MNLNVKAFGALGDGASSDNDNLAIQAALDAVPESGGVVYIPAGRYVISRSLLPKSNTKITGDGAASVLIRKGERTYDGLQLILGRGLQNVSVEDLAVDYNGVRMIRDPTPGDEGQKTFAAAVAFINGCENIAVRRLKIYDSNPQGVCCSTGIVVLRSENIWIENNLLTDGPRIKAGGLNRRVVVRGNYVINPNDNGITLAIQKDTEYPITSEYFITNNTVEGAAGAAIYLGDDGGKDAVGDQLITSIIISDNVLRGVVPAEGRMLYLAIGTAARNIHITGNLVENLDQVLRQSTQGILVKPRNNGHSPAENILVANNTIVGKFDHGNIWLNHVVRARVINNQVSGFVPGSTRELGGIGIRLSNVDQVILANNLIDFQVVGIQYHLTEPTTKVEQGSLFIECDRDTDFRP